MTNKITWHEHGEIIICEKGWPKFPLMPEVSGLYRITLNDGRIYLGEAGSLKRRLYEYRRPTPGIEQEHRVYNALVDARGGKIDIYTEGDLSTRKKRMEIEKVEIQNALSSGLILVNDEGDNAAAILKTKISFHESEIEKLRHKLSLLEQDC